MERVEGAENTERLLDRLTSAMARFQEQLDRVYRQQRERDDARRLRNDQVLIFVRFALSCLVLSFCFVLFLFDFVLFRVVLSFLFCVLCFFSFVLFFIFIFVSCLAVLFCFALFCLFFMCSTRYVFVCRFFVLAFSRRQCAACFPKCFWADGTQL